MAEQKKPNIVMIMTDDVGTWNLSAYHPGMIGGSTPNIDRFALWPPTVQSSQRWCPP